MKSINAVIELHMALMTNRGMALPSQQAEIKTRIIRGMTNLYEHIDPIKKQLSGTQVYFEEFWKTPNKFQQEEYLHDKLLPDALIR